MDDDLKKPGYCWAGTPAAFNAPLGGGGPGRFSLFGPLTNYSAMPDPRASIFDVLENHPSSPAARMCVAPKGYASTAGATAQVSTPAAAAAPASSESLLTVSQGQVTFDAEGNNIPANRYYSRKVIWPQKGESGVTIGRGYDMGSRTKAQVKADLMAAGMDASVAEKFAEGAAKKGVLAKKFVDDNREKLGEISLAVQNQLFENIYPGYVTRAKTNYNTWTTAKDGKALKGKVDWDKLDPAIRDVLVDFVYQGFTKGPNPMTHGMTNDYDTLIKYIKASMSDYEAGRHRADYLEKAKKAKEAKKTKEVKKIP